VTAEVAKALADAGPWAVVVFIGGMALISLWREHLAADKDDRRQRDEAMLLVKDAIDGTRRMAAAWEARNRRDEKHGRSGDE